MASDQRPTTNGFSIVGKPTAMVDAAGKTTGAGKYTDDLSLPGMLVGRILHSPYPHARIKRIDTSRAEKSEGVLAVVTGKTRPIHTASFPSATTSTRSPSIRSDMSVTTSLASLPSTRQQQIKRSNGLMLNTSSSPPTLIRKSR